MYAVVKIGGHQYVVKPGDIIETQRLHVEPNTSIEIDEVYLVKTDDGKALVGTPKLSAKVRATVLEHFKGPKIIGFKYRPKKRYRRRWGHRQPMTRLKIEAIEVS